MSSRPDISFEYFPPKTPAGRDKLLDVTTPALAELAPAYFSVTYGAGGSTRDTTRGTVMALKERGVEVAPHLSFGLDDEATIAGLLGTYRDAGIRRLVALRGDLPSGTGAGARLVYANELVRLRPRTHGDHFHIEVAAYPEIHPQAESFDSDLHFLKGQVRRRRGQCDHPVFLQRGCLLLFPRPLRGNRYRQADPRRCHADHQLRQPRALLAQLRRRDPALDLPAPRGLRRRPGEHPQAFGDRGRHPASARRLLENGAPRASTSTP
jgi:hypothetical protein